jgi:uncharacterized DUF497 family protein
VLCVFDRAKDEVNRAKHGVSLALAEVLFAGPHVSVTDDRFDYGEVRKVAFGPINGRVLRAYSSTAVQRDALCLCARPIRAR